MWCRQLATSPDTLRTGSEALAVCRDTEFRTQKNIITIMPAPPAQDEAQELLGAGQDANPAPPAPEATAQVRSSNLVQPALHAHLSLFADGGLVRAPAPTEVLRQSR